ncbi:MAG: helicase, partial [Deltaproteobacteria bacterium]|nr:helicase [Deltaproteobacteria bacterium]
MGLLRQALTEVCLEYLNADLFILDEFQRYKDLIRKEEKSPAIRLARRVFGIEGAKILMLSATPFKPYTGSMDLGSGEDHYAEFELVLKFLMEERDETFWKQYVEDRKAFFQFLRHPRQAVNRLPEAVRTKNRLEKTYLEAMVRTERTLVSDDHNTLLSNRLHKPFKLEIEDVKDFIQTDRIARALSKVTRHRRLYNPIEYSKSAPFPLSFMERYKLKEMLHRHKRKNRIKRTLKANPNCWIDFKKINSYRPLTKSVLPNGKLRFLLEDTLYSGGWKLLWVSPTLPYYELTGAFGGQENFSKTLAFSSWVLVPRMIATLVSYEAERLAIGDKRSISRQEKGQKRVRKYFQKGKEKRYPRPQLVFSGEGKRRTAANMTNFCLLYPSPTLAELYHPRQNLIEMKRIKEIRRALRQKIKLLFREVNLKRFETEAGESGRWYWAAPLLLDKYREEAKTAIEDWIYLSDLPGDSNIDPEADEDTKETKSREYDHFYNLYEAFENPEDIGLGKMPDDLKDVLVDMVLGSPAIAAFRSLKENFHSADDIAKGATIIAKGFLSLFNKPESIAIVRLFTEHRKYWHKVLDYCVSGNIQAMIDEFIFLLFECENFRRNAEELAEHFSAVMNIRTSNIRVDSLKSFFDATNNPTMRCHFALDFGNQRIETASGTKRVINLRKAFNSPFRPFILASTSIGQEGLDFHYYCRKVMHWNLPGNAIDIEQREGRINRYMGHVIRKNIASKYLKDLSDPVERLWQELFRVGKTKEHQDDKCDLVPFWHVECENGSRIERIVPLHPFSKDRSKLKYLLEILTYYRLTFGQPRQEELVEALMKEGMGKDEIELLTDNLV